MPDLSSEEVVRTPKVIIELQANTGAAIAQIQAFAKAQRDAFDAVRAGNADLTEATVKVSRLTDSAKGGAEGFFDFNREARSLAHGGLADILRAVPIVGESLAKFAHTLSGFPLLLGGLVGAGIGVLKWLENLDEQSTKTLHSVTALSEGMSASFQQTQLEVAKIRAESEGKALTALNLGRDQELKAAEDVKNARIAKAREELDTMTWYGKRRTQLSQDALNEITAATDEETQKKIRIDAKYTADYKKLLDERKKASLDWADQEMARLQELDDAMRTLARSRAAATLESQAGAAERAGDPVAAARVRYAQQTAALQAALEDQLQAQQAKLAKGEIMDTEFEARKRELYEITAQRQGELTAQFARQQQDAYSSVDTALRTLLGKLGPGFEDLSEKLDISKEVDDSRQSFQTIQTAFEQGRISASQAAEMVRQVTEQLLAQGAAIRDIALVVPPQLQELSSLFRNVQQEINVTIDDTRDVKVAMDNLSAAPLLSITDGWYQAAQGAEAYRVKVLEIIRLGSIIPQAGMLELPGAGALVPQSGLSADARRELSAQQEDDARRGL